MAPKKSRLATSATPELPFRIHECRSRRMKTYSENAIVRPKRPATKSLRESEISKLCGGAFSDGKFRPGGA